MGNPRLSEEVQKRHRHAETRDQSGERADQASKGDSGIGEEPIEVVRGSGNVFRDLGFENPDLRQLKALLAAEIIKTLDEVGLTVRQARERTGIAAADFSRIRTVKLDRFTVDRLMTILDRMGQEVRVAISVIPQAPAASRAALA